ncbi:MAG TPA: TfoX/Sxy family protein [Polyangiaceae bacterium]|nr:TfoX/Sxy family protein [Polyangiaceae bacterium]
MPTDEKVAGHIRAALADSSSVREVEMFGGLCFMLNGNMVAASSHRGLLVRVGELGMSDALARGAQSMIMNGRQMKGFVWVPGTPDGRAVKAWLRLARAFVETLPAKQSGKTKNKKSKP